MAVTSTNLVAGGATVTIGSDLGAIKDGITTTPTLELLTVDLEQELTPSRAWRIGERFTVEFTLCEPTLANVKIAWDVDNAITGVGPFALVFGDHQSVPQDRVVAVTGVRPGVTPGVRTLNFFKTHIETPAPLVFAKRQETNLKCVLTCLTSTGVAVGGFSDVA